MSVFAALSAYLTIRAEYKGPRRNLYIFKPLTLVLIILLALLVKYPVDTHYRHMIIAGLVLSLVGDVFLMLPSDRFVAGLVSFLLAHLAYIAAFGYSPFRTSTIIAGALLLIFGLVMLRFLWPGVGKLKLPVVIYVLVVIVMAWMSIGRYLVYGPAGSILAAAGALLFVTSDSILALDKFKSRFHNAQRFILLTYFLAQWLIALST